MKHRLGKKAVVVVGLVTLGITSFGQIVQHLWNWLMPTLFRLPAIGFWQALGLMALSWILFGGFRGGPRRYWRGRRRFAPKGLTPEQREKIRGRFGGRCGCPEVRA